MMVDYFIVDDDRLWQIMIIVDSKLWWIVDDGRQQIMVDDGRLQMVVDST